MTDDNFHKLVNDNLNELLENNRLRLLIAQELMLKGYIKLIDEADEVLSIDDYNSVVKEDSVEDWVEEYRDLFQYAVRPGRGLKALIIKKLVWFISQTSYDKSQILSATKRYLDDCANHDRYNKDPDKFISSGRKDNKTFSNSMLYEWIQREKDSDGEPISTGYITI